MYMNMHAYVYVYVYMYMYMLSVRYYTPPPKPDRGLTVEHALVALDLRPRGMCGAWSRLLVAVARHVSPGAG